MMYYLGVDVGTTSAKAVAFSKTGEVLVSWSCSYKMFHPQPTWSEQDPEEVFQAIINCTNKVIASLAPGKPLFVAFTAAMHGLLVIDAEGKPLTHCIIWADNRAGEIADELKNTEWGKEIYHSTGVPVHAMSPLCKLLWLKENNPAIFNKAYKFISIKEYVYHKLFDEYIIDASIASATGIFNLKTLSWDERILNFLNIIPSSLSQVVSIKEKRVYNKTAATQQWLMPEGTTFIIGGSDGALANLGTGAMNNNSMAISMGTSGAARIITDEVTTDNKMRTFCYYLKNGMYIVGGASNNGAIVLEWLKDNLLETEESFTELFQRAETITPGSEGLICIPYILGERAPVWNSKARGVFFGLNINHNKAHLVRACMEGAIYCLYSIAKILLEKRVITEIYATGGFTQSSLWLQMLADVCNIKVLVSGAVESSALGAVMIGLEAMEIEPLPRKGVLLSYEPNLLNHEVYMKGFEKFDRIYELIKDELISDSVPLRHMQLK
jgi:gluconokinase